MTLTDDIRKELEILEQKKEELSKICQETKLCMIKEFDGEYAYQKAKAEIEYWGIIDRQIEKHKQEAKIRVKESIHNMDLSRKDRFNLINIFEYLIDGNWAKDCNWEYDTDKGGD